MQCSESSHCTSAASSKCVSSSCASCSDNTDCNHISGKPVCESGTCVQSTIDTESQISYFDCTIKYDTSYSDFIAQNGESLFIERLKIKLSLKTSQIRIKSIKSGSTIVDFTILEDSSASSEAATSISGIQSNLKKAIDTDQLNILDATIQSYSLQDPVILGSTSDSGEGKSSGIGVGVIAGIAGGFIVVVVLGGVGIYIKKKKSLKSKKVQNSPLKSSQSLDFSSVNITSRNIILESTNQT